MMFFLSSYLKFRSETKVLDKIAQNCIVLQMYAKKDWTASIIVLTDDYLTTFSGPSTRQRDVKRDVKPWQQQHHLVDVKGVLSLQDLELSRQLRQQQHLTLRRKNSVKTHFPGKHNMVTAIINSILYYTTRTEQMTRENAYCTQSDYARHPWEPPV